VTRVFLGACLGVVLVWATAACSQGDDQKTTTNKICTSDDQCSAPFSECEHINNVTTGTCTKECTGDDSCPSDYACRQQADIGLEPSCLQRCETKTCPEAFNCITNPDNGTKTCAPNAWFAD